MLRPDGDGFTVDFESLDKRKTIGDDERLLLKMRSVLQEPPEGTPLVIDFSASEGQRLAGTLETLERLQPWSADVLQMSRDLRKRLGAIA